jgi:hypothetical protein
MKTSKAAVLGLALLAATGTAANLWAGEPRLDGPPPPFGDHLGGPGTFTMYLGHDGKVVKGVPYQAEAVTEIIQTLADGNRIVRKTTSAIFRDSEGRTRREQALGAIGPLVASGDAPPTAFIHDPVAGVSYVLEADKRVARRLKMPPHRERPERKGDDDAEGPGDMFFTAPLAQGALLGPGKIERRALPKPLTEPLGHQTLEGIEVEGTRSTVTIPAGEIGNEKELRIVSERWYSAELQTVVLSKRSDPRLGETTYRLTGILRTEPDHALFEIPAGFTLKDGPPEMGFLSYGRRKDATTSRNPAP